MLQQQAVVAVELQLVEDSHYLVQWALSAARRVALVIRRRLQLQLQPPRPYHAVDVVGVVDAHDVDVHVGGNNCNYIQAMHIAPRFGGGIVDIGGAGGVQRNHLARYSCSGYIPHSEGIWDQRQRVVGVVDDDGELLLDADAADRQRWPAPDRRPKGRSSGTTPSPGSARLPPFAPPPLVLRPRLVNAPRPPPPN